MFTGLKYFAQEKSCTSGFNWMNGKGPVSFGYGNGKELNRNHDLLFLLAAPEVTFLMACLCLVFLVCFLSFSKCEDAS